jgi:hypothetical protein
MKTLMQRLGILCLLVILCGTFAAADDQATVAVVFTNHFNGYFLCVELPCGEVIIAIIGNWVDRIDVNATLANDGLNPFLWEVTHLGKQGGTGSTLDLSYDAEHNVTRAIFKGDQSGQKLNWIAAGDKFQYDKKHDCNDDQHNCNPHWGLLPKKDDKGHEVQVKNEVAYFACIVVGQEVRTAVIGVRLPDRARTAQVIFAQSTDSVTNQVAGVWIAGPSGKPKLINNGPNPITLKNVGYLPASSLPDVEDLNFGGTPPPGYPGSMFTPLPQFDGMTMEVGDTLDLPVPDDNNLPFPTPSSN